ncbi:hypothetical protein OCA23_27260 [Bacillus cereus]|nr:hypothetical protein [Bacillus cereus]
MIKAIVPEKVLENIKIGETVNVSAEEFMSSYLPGGNRPLITHSPIISKIRESYRLELQKIHW